jgi:putative radical SAM enzyme (TIGR03279 family)
LPDRSERSGGRPSPVFDERIVQLFMQIMAIKEGSTASRSTLQIGDRIKRVNGRAISDFLDLYFHLSEETVDLEVERETNGARQALTVSLERRYGEEFGLEFPVPKFRVCGNKCPFCFVDQNPAGMRKPLYVRDDDYRFSFLDGHFITLTNLKESDFERIIEYHMSPLYVSVHALDPEVRTYLLGTPRAKEIRPQIERLTDAGIVLQTQIVALPGVNDGKVMAETVRGLFEYYPKVQSIGVVPIGLTAHMPAERGLRTYTPEEARVVCGQVDAMTRRYREKIGKGFVYLADELLLLAGLPVPTTPYYDGYLQLGNGVGMMRELMNDFRKRKPAVTRLKRRKIRRIAVLSATSPGPSIRKLLAGKFPASEGIDITTVETRNATFGDSVTVTGLLGGRDLIRELDALSFDLALLPPNAVTENGTFIDDVTLDEMNERFGGRIAVGFDRLWEN